MKTSNEDLCECCHEFEACTSVEGLRLCGGCAEGDDGQEEPSGGWPVEVPTGLMLNDDEGGDEEPPMFV